MTGTIYSLIPPLITIALVVFTKRVLLSLGLGVISAALILAEFNIFTTFSILWHTFLNLIFETNGLLGFLNSWNMSIVIFLLALGVITSYVILSGGAHAFTQSITSRIKTREGVQYTSFGLGLILFIDDYFNALVVGNVSKPLATEKRISRARLSYIVDSTSAPACIAAPISSWATGIMGIMTVIFATTGIERNTFAAFIEMIPYHFYVVTALTMVFITIRYNFNIGSMKRYEQEALENRDSSIARNEVSLKEENEIRSSKGTIWDLILPILALTLGTISAMFVTGYLGVERNSVYNLFYNILDHIDLPASLLIGGFLGLITSMVMTYRHINYKEITKKDYGHAFYTGAASMFGSILILFLAWAISDLIGELDLGNYLASIITNANIPISFIPVVMFIVAGFMAFATGTSWGSFGILLPIAGTVAAAIDINLMLPVMSAVLSGAVLGDHASPISDTTLLSATGSGCEVTAHFSSQLPYALLSGFIAALGYLTYGFSRNLAFSYLIIFIFFILVILYAKHLKKTNMNSNLTT